MCVCVCVCFTSIVTVLFLNVAAMVLFLAWSLPRQWAKGKQRSPRSKKEKKKQEEQVLSALALASASAAGDGSSTGSSSSANGTKTQLPSVAEIASIFSTSTAQVHCLLAEARSSQPSVVLPMRLLCGNGLSAKSARVMRQARVTHVLNMTGGELPNYFEAGRRPAEAAGNEGAGGGGGGGGGDDSVCYDSANIQLAYGALSLNETLEPGII